MSDSVVTFDALKAVAGLAPEEASPAGAIPASVGSRSHRILRVGDWLKDREIAYRVKNSASSDGRTVYLLNACPFNPEHGDHAEVAIMQSPSGKLSAKCHHNSCEGHGWSQFRDAIGKPEAHHWDIPSQETETRDSSAGFQLRVMTSSEFCAADFRQHFLIRKVLVEGQPCIVGGPKKCLKTGTLIDLAISLGTATPFLSNPDFEVPERVRTCLISGESGAATLRRTAYRVCQARQQRLEDADVLWSEDLPQLANLKHLEELGDAIALHSIRVLILDPAYLCLLTGATHVNAGNVFEMGSILKGIGDLGAETGCTIIIAHHTRKKDRKERYRATDLEDLAMSGFAEFARQWILLGRRSEYRSDGHHDLWLNIGGSAGHSGTYALTVDEGQLINDLDQRTWSTHVERAVEAIERKKQERTCEMEQRKKAKLDSLLETLKGRGFGETKSQLRKMTSPQLTSSEFNDLIEVLIAENKVIRLPIKKNGREESGFLAFDTIFQVPGR